LTLTGAFANVNGVSVLRFVSNFITVCVSVLFLTSCQAEKPIVAPRSKIEIDPSQVQELSIAKDDALEGDAWFARLEKRERWVLDSGPQGEALVDIAADFRFVRHLLDTLKSLELRPVPEGIRPERMGMSRPLFRIKWREKNSEIWRELKVGSELGPEADPMVEVDGGGAGTGKQIAMGRGALFQILGELRQFDRLRERRLFLRELDDFDAVKVISGGKSIQFERVGEQWGDARGKLLRGNSQEKVSLALESLAHLQIARFPELYVGQSSLSGPMRGPAIPAQNVKVVLEDRRGDRLQVELVTHSGGVQALSSERAKGKARFNLYPQARQWVNALSQLAK
jgi:hypothetical protein